MVTSPAYPPKIVYTLLYQLISRFLKQHGSAVPQPMSGDLSLDFDALKEFVLNYQDPAAADTTGRIHKGLKDTTEVLYKTIDQVLERGEKLEDIMAKSHDLSSTSQAFYKTSKKTRCCTIL